MEAAQEELRQAPEQPAETGGKKRIILPRPPKGGKRWARRLAVLALAAGAVYWFFLRPGGEGAASALAGRYTAEQARYRDLTVSVSATGTLVPAESYQVKSLVSGDILDAPFEAGDRIEKGDLLYRVDPGDAEASLEQAGLSVRQAQLSYDEIIAGLKPSAGTAGVVQQVLVEMGELVSPGTPIAEIADTSTMTLTLPFQSADAARLAPGQEALVTLEGTLETLRGTVEAVASADLVGAGGALVRPVTIRVENPGALTAAAAATATVGQIACAGSGTFAASARQTVTARTSGEVTDLLVSAGSRVAAGDVLATLGGAAAQTSVENAAIALESARLSYQRAQQALDNYTITAPISGTVIEKNLKTGDKVDSMDSGSMAVLYDLTSLELQVNVSELDIGKIQPGQEVEITAEAVPGAVFPAVVERVSINGTTTNGFTTYPVTIRLEEYGALNPGMNVSARIIVERAEQVLSVPVAAVDRDSTVLVAGEGALSPDGTVADPTRATAQKVALGRGDGDYVEITDGLSQGDTVLVPDQTAGGAGAGTAVAGG